MSDILVLSVSTASYQEDHLIPEVQQLLPCFTDTTQDGDDERETSTGLYTHHGMTMIDMAIRGQPPCMAMVHHL